MNPGDFCLLRTKRTWKVWQCWDTWLVWLGQMVGILLGRFGKDVPLSYARFTHSIFVVSETEMIQADEQGVHVSPLTDLDGVDYVVVDSQMTDAQRATAIAHARFCVHEAYAFVRFVFLALVYVTGCWLSVGLDAHKLCSGLGADCLCRGPANFPHDAANMSPVNLAVYYKVAP